MNIRLQTHDINASDVLHDGLDDLDKTADKLKEKFQEALRQHRG
jgi:DNA-directed RNA polymerase subunit L